MQPLVGERDLLEETHEQLRLIEAKELAKTDPKYLINEMKYLDPQTQLWADFRMFPPEGWEIPNSWDMRPEGKDFHPSADEGASDWFWQSLFIDWLHDPAIRVYLVLKARQLGITLLCCAYALWLMLFKPGFSAGAFSYEEGEAFKLSQALWEMFISLPPIMRDHVEVVTPTELAGVPTEWVRLRHKTGELSTFQAMPATKKHGHGGRFGFGIMDEASRQDYAREIFTGLLPAAISRGGKLALVSTANGVSNKETGEGNFFHHVFATKRQRKISYRFLPWNLEPTRDKEWYENVAMALDDVERNQQYPLNEHDAFMLSGAIYFNREALEHYAGAIMEPLRTGQFVAAGKRRGRFLTLRDGILEIYEMPHPDAKYAIGVDTATGSGADYTSAHVIDLSSGMVVAHLHAKIEAARAAFQLHYLGKFYNNALICVERQAGSGEAVITVLREGTENLPPYSKLYRHTTYTKGNKPISEDFGYPMGAGPRSAVLDGLKLFVRQRGFPWLDAGTLDEMQTFVYKDTRPSPRAEDGCNDDRVFSLALAHEMYHRFGQRPEKRRRWKKTPYRPPPTRSAA